VLMKG